MSENIESTDTVIPIDHLIYPSLPTPTNNLIQRQISDPRSESEYSYKSTLSRPIISHHTDSVSSTPLSNNGGSFNFTQLTPIPSYDDERRRSSGISTIICISDKQELINPPTTSQNKFNRVFNRVSSIPVSTVPHSAPVDGSHALRTMFKTNVNTHTISRRENAELQLNAILNDRPEALPAFVHCAHGGSLEDMSKELNIQPFILQRLLRVTNSLSSNDVASSMSENNMIRLTRVLGSTLDVRALVFFMMLDEDNDKRVTRDEMKQFLEIYLKNVSFNSYRLTNAVEVFLKRFRFETQTEIDFEEFYSILTEDSALLESFSGFTIDPTRCSNIRPSSSPSKMSWYKTFYKNLKLKLTLKYLRDNLSKVILILLYILVNLALVLYVIIYRSKIIKSGVFVVFARIGGILLDFNCSLIVVLMFKQTILFIRSHEILRRLIPVDSHIDFHKFVGKFIAVLAILHTVAHIINFALVKKYSWAEYMFTTIPDIGWVGGFAPLSGIILCIILGIMVICSMEWIRGKAHFQIFYWTHTLYIVFFIFLIIHAEDFWKWAVGPLSWLLLEKLYSFLQRYSPHVGRTHLISATIEKSNVIKLTIHRPKHFTFKPGDYITINLPHVAFYEFHPFTISSAPEQTDILQVHIHATGNWTKRVYKRFIDMSENNGDHQQVDVIVHRADRDPIKAIADERDEQNAIENENNNNNTIQKTTMRMKKEKIIVNGPYSSCARYIFDCEHVILISSGIGVTPYASILSSLMAQFHASRTICQHCQRINYHKTALVENRRIKKVDFIWVIKDYKSFEWFLKLLHQLEQEQEDYLAINRNEQRFLNIHLYFTGMKDEQSVGHYPFQLITQIWSQSVGEDIITGLKSRTHLGRPKWDQLFTQLTATDNHSTNNNVNVFFCGLKDMGKDIHECSTKHHFRYYEEKF